MVGGHAREDGLEQQEMSEKEEVNLCWDRTPMARGESVVRNYENEAGGISIQGVPGVKENK